MAKNDDTEQLIDDLITKLLDSDIPWEVYEKFKEIGEPAVGPLIAAMDNAMGNERLARNAGYILESMGDQRGINALVERIISEIPTHDRLTQAGLISDLSSNLENLGELAVTPLLPYLEHSHWRVRCIVVLALGRIGDESAIEPLMKLMTDEDHDIWELTGIALGKIIGKIIVKGDNTKVSEIIEKLKEHVAKQLTEKQKVDAQKSMRKCFATMCEKARKGKQKIQEGVISEEKPKPPTNKGKMFRVQRRVTNG